MPFCHEWDEAKKVPKEVFIKAAQAGILGASVQNEDPSLLPYPLPAGVKLEEFDAFHRLIVVDELCRCGSGGVSITSTSPLFYTDVDLCTKGCLGLNWWIGYRIATCGSLWL